MPMCEQLSHINFLVPLLWHRPCVLNGILCLSLPCVASGIASTQSTALTCAERIDEQQLHRLTSSVTHPAPFVPLLRLSRSFTHPIPIDTPRCDVTLAPLVPTSPLVPHPPWPWYVTGHGHALKETESLHIWRTCSCVMIACIPRVPEIDRRVPNVYM